MLRYFLINHYYATLQWSAAVVWSHSAEYVDLWRQLCCFLPLCTKIPTGAISVLIESIVSKFTFFLVVKLESKPKFLSSLKVQLFDSFVSLFGTLLIHFLYHFTILLNLAHFSDILENLSCIFPTILPIWVGKKIEMTYALTSGAKKRWFRANSLLRRHEITKKISN